MPADEGKWVRSKASVNSAPREAQLGRKGPRPCRPSRAGVCHLARCSTLGGDQALARFSEQTSVATTSGGGALARGVGAPWLPETGAATDCAWSTDRPAVSAMSVAMSAQSQGPVFGFILIDPGKSDVVSQVVADRVFPDRRFDQAQAQLMNRFLSWCVRHWRGWRRYSINLVCMHLY